MRKEEDILPVNLYDREGQLLLAKGTPLTQRMLEVVQKRGYDIQTLLQQRLEQENIRQELQPLFIEFQNKYLGLDLRQLDRACEQVVQVRIAIRQHDLLHTYVCALVGYVDAIYVHSINTAILTALLSPPAAADSRQLVMAALFHDLGTLLVPPEVLAAADNLSEQTMELFAAHTTFGHSLLARPGIPQLLAEVALTHHERNNGTGYPQGLKIGQISPLAQVVGLADTFDCLTSGKPLGSAISVGEALELLQLGVDRHFPRALVNNLLALFECSDQPAGDSISAGSDGS